MKEKEIIYTKRIVYSMLNKIKNQIRILELKNQKQSNRNLNTWQK